MRSESQDSYSEQSRSKYKREQEKQEGSDKNSEFQFVMPDSKSYLKACVQCGLAKSKNQWEKTKNCQNCGTFMRIESSQNTTGKFMGLIGLINPKKSFIRKRARIHPRNGKRLKSAAYAI